MRKQLLAGMLGLMVAAVSAFPVSAHHVFGHHEEDGHDCYITEDHFCEIGRGVCDGAGYCMDDHSRGYCNQSCQASQAGTVSSGGHHSERGHHGGRHHW